MRLLGVPLSMLAANCAATLVIFILMFLPAIADFGNTAIGTEDIQFFAWLFWHYGNSVDSLGNPLYADEIFHPYGISLVPTTTTPLQALVSLVLPGTMLGKITILQLLSYLLGGIFSFALAYRFCKSFLPSMAASFTYNFSIFHFEKAIHHLNYNMAFAFLPLFFISYFSMSQKPKRNEIALVSLSLLLIALNELTTAIMCGFIVFLDIFYKYSKESNVRLFTVRNVVAVAFAVAVALLLTEGFVLFGAPAFLIYVIPPLIPMAAMLLIAGDGNLLGREKESSQFSAMAIAAVPAALFMAVLALQPVYDFALDSTAANLLRYPIAAEYLFMPSGFMLLSEITGSLETQSEHGIYLGLGTLALIASSFLIKGAGKDEGYFRSWFLLSLLFAFPIVVVFGFAAGFSPFIAQLMFPLMGVQRVSARFVMFALVFLAPLTAVFFERIFRGKKYGMLILALLTIGTVAERWPSTGELEFTASIPEFYNGMEGSVFLYPNFNYHTLLEEIYAQSVHGNELSYGTVSRFPTGGNPLYDFYQDIYLQYKNGTSPSEVAVESAEFAKGKYDYVVVQKRSCENPDCFFRKFSQMDVSGIRTALESELGKPVFEDGKILVYSAKADSQ